MATKAVAIERLKAWQRDPMLFLTDVLTHPDGSSYGVNLDPWQREDLATFFADRRHTWWERPRGHSKTQDAAAASLTELVLGQPGGRIYFAATDQDQAALAFDSLRGFVTRSPILSSVVRLLKREAVVDATDSTLTVLAADAPGSWGLRPTLVVVDELEAWRTEAAEEFFHALFSALGKRKGARMLIASTAGWDRTSLCWRLREKVQDDPAWVFSRRGQCASWVSAAFLEEQKRLLPDHVFRMLHLNEWTEAGGAFLTYEEVQDIFDHALAPVFECRNGRHYLGLDVGLAHDATVAAVVHREADGTLRVDAIQTWQGAPEDRVNLASVQQWVADAWKRYSDLRIYVDPWQAVGMVQALQAKGIRAQEVVFTPAYRGKVYANLLELIRSRKLRSFPHKKLKDELLGLSFVDKAGNLRVDHRPGSHDDHPMAVAVACLAAVEDHTARFVFV